MERYRSGHNGAASKAVSPLNQGHVGSNPTLSASGTTIYSYPKKVAVLLHSRPFWRVGTFILLKKGKWDDFHKNSKQALPTLPKPKVGTLSKTHPRRS